MAQIRRIKSEEARQVCFSKLRAELFKKAKELAILCGAEVAAIIFSPAGEAFSFGYPSFEAVLERFAPTGVGCGVGGARAGEDNGKLADLIREYRELRVQLAVEMARKERVEAALAKERAAGNPMVAWLEADVRDLGEEELVAFEAALTKLQASLNNSRPDMDMQIQQQMMMARALPPPPPPGFVRRHVGDAAAESSFPGPN